MKIRYDEEANALYIKLQDSRYYESDEIQDGFILDYDAEGNIIGIEILDVDKYLTVSDLATVNFEINRRLSSVERVVGRG